MDALNLDLWAELALVGGMSIDTYLRIDEELAVACLMALQNKIEGVKKEKEAQQEVHFKKQHSLNLLAEVEAKHKR
jgi:hypothetical protein